MQATDGVSSRTRRSIAGRARTLVGAVALLAVLASCSSGSTVAYDEVEITRQGTAGEIVVHPDEVVTGVDPLLFGTNVPAWLLPELVTDPDFRTLTTASGTTLLRFPGGSWSNDYDWLGCEEGDPDRCGATWGLKPSDFVELLESTGLPGMWTAAINGTAEEAAAAVAFFNGAVDDERPIGTDREGRDWLTVGHWARLRADGGHPEPAAMRYWEVGNEVYGAVASVGESCAPWGWENVWTCDPAEYVAGTPDHDGYLAFREAMLAVDPGIEVGAVGVGDRGEWSNWDDVVIGDARGSIDFYVVHQYGSDGDVPAGDVLELPAEKWPAIASDVRTTLADHGMAGVPIAITEHNLVAFIDGDDERLMTTALNAFYLAETLGQMARNGVSIANQWNLANGRAPNGSDYGLMDAQTHDRTPAYYAMALWSRFGDELVWTDVGSDLDDLVVYGGRGADGAARLLVLNPTDEAVRTTVSIAAGAGAGAGTVTADEVVADSLDATTVSFNGTSTPSFDLSEPGRTVTPAPDGTLDQEFPAYSISLLTWAP